MMSTKRRARAVSSVALATTFLLAGPALGQAPPPDRPGAEAPLGGEPGDGKKDALAVSPEARAEATEHYNRGVAFYNDGDYLLALIEFERSFQIVPHYRIRYNIGQVNYQLNRYALALEALQKYLEEGDTRVPADRRASVEKDIAALRTRVARVTVTTNVPGAEIFVDDAARGKTPLSAPLLVDAGSRKIEARLAGYTTATRAITLAGGDARDVSLELIQEKVATVTTIVQREEKGSLLWVGWAGTGALAAATVITGVVAFSNAKQLENLRQTVSTPAERQSTADTVKTLSLATDVMGAAALVGAGVCLYFTLKKPSEKSPPRVTAEPAGLGFRLHGTF